MTEQEYVDLRDLQRIDTAITIISGILPEISSVIPEGEFKMVTRCLSSWQEKFYAKKIIDE